MTSQMMLAIGLPLTVTFVGIFSAICLSRAVVAAMEAIARQPEAAAKIQVSMVLGCAFIEALTIYALVMVFVLQTRLG